ncbi:MAG TPA: hypothetical protein DIT05_04150 [Morganella sp. (in: Bacteria)]|nr:hypothetical protein [Morganella sp. (in: enterobacteria)]
MHKIILSILVSVIIAGCSAPEHTDSDAGSKKNDPYENSTVNTIRENQAIYKEQQRMKGIY